MDKFVANMKAIRVEKGITIEQMAEAMERTVPTIKKWENGHAAHINTLTIEKMAKVLGVTPARLVGWED